MTKCSWCEVDLKVTITDVGEGTVGPFCTYKCSTHYLNTLANDLSDQVTEVATERNIAERDKEACFKTINNLDDKLRLVKQAIHQEMQCKCNQEVGFGISPVCAKCTILDKLED